MSFLKLVARLTFDRRVAHAFPALYDYLRWVDDVVDSEEGSKTSRLQFIHQQKANLDLLYSGIDHHNSNMDSSAMQFQGFSEAKLAVPFVSMDLKFAKRLKPHVFSLLASVEMDCLRRGTILSAGSLKEIILLEGGSILEIAQFFASPDYPYPARKEPPEAMACVWAHNLRDFVEDASIGHYNIAEEDISKYGVDPTKIAREPLRIWAREKTEEALELMRSGQRQVKGKQPLRCYVAWNAVCTKYSQVLLRIRANDYDLTTLNSQPSHKPIWYLRSCATAIKTSVFLAAS